MGGCGSVGKKSCANAGIFTQPELQKGCAR